MPGEYEKRQETFQTYLSSYVPVKKSRQHFLSHRPNTVSRRTVSKTELSEFCGAHWASGSELNEFLLWANAGSPSFSRNSPSLLQNSVSSLFRNSALETVFRPFPTLTNARAASSSTNCNFILYIISQQKSAGMGTLNSNWWVSCSFLKRASKWSLLAGQGEALRPCVVPQVRSPSQPAAGHPRLHDASTTQGFSEALPTCSTMFLHSMVATFWGATEPLRSGWPPPPNPTHPDPILTPFLTRFRPELDPLGARIVSNSGQNRWSGRSGSVAPSKSCNSMDSQELSGDPNPQYFLKSMGGVLLGFPVFNA